ncbi:MAG: tryptophan 2,3-dioxygenase family protein [Bacteroidota bacterium]
MAQKDLHSQLSQILERLNLLDQKYAGMGQDMLSYLDGLYYSNGLTYWEYVHLDSLLGLQTPRTPFKDEIIFITYHQISELMFKLVKLELESLTADQGEESEYHHPEAWRKRIGRACNYFRHLCNSFDIMLSGMDKEEMRKFRMALLPASGFQSVQFRHIELMSTGLMYLLQGDYPDPESASTADLFPFIYWKKGGIDLETGLKTITLRAFEERYDEELLQLIRKYHSRNLNHLFLQAGPEIREDAEIIELLRTFDQTVNVLWKLSHMAAAARHLVHGEKTEEGTGGTNWRTFLPPRYQKVIFFPSLWNETEQDEWGKAAVVKHFQESVAQNWMQNPS